jgi:hypothetical protein
MRTNCSPRAEDIGALAARQHGVVAHRQLANMGLGPSAIQHWLMGGRLHRVHKGVYAVGHPVLSLQGRRMAAVLACGPGAVLSHRDASELWDIHRTSRRAIDVTASRARRGHPGIDIHRARRLDPRDRTIRDGLPVTTVARTLLDLAEVVRLRQLERAVDEAERRRLFDLNEVNATCRRNPGRRGIKPLRIVIANATEPPATRRELEGRFAEFCRDAGLPRPAFNVMVAGYEVDAVWEKAKLVVELDSWEFHGGRRAFETDRERDTALHLAQYRPVRVTWRKLTREPAKLARELRVLSASSSAP